jgi:two-component system invasion response regulator UvrY
VVRVLLVEDHPGLSYAIENVFAKEMDIELVASEASAVEATARCGQADVVVIDYEREGQDGLELAMTLTRAPGAPSVLIYTAYADVWMIVATIVAGADGLLSKAGFGDDLSRAVRVLAKGDRFMPRVAHRTLERVVAGLPPNERSTTSLLLTGADAATIARMLSITEAELDARRSAILNRLRLPSTREPVGFGSIGRATSRRIEVG